MFCIICGSQILYRYIKAYVYVHESECKLPRGTKETYRLERKGDEEVGEGMYSLYNVYMDRSILM